MTKLEKRSRNGLIVMIRSSAFTLGGHSTRSEDTKIWGGPGPLPSYPTVTELSLPSKPQTQDTDYHTCWSNHSPTCHWLWGYSHLLKTTEGHPLVSPCFETMKQTFTESKGPLFSIFPLAHPNSIPSGLFSLVRNLKCTLGRGTVHVRVPSCLHGEIHVSLSVFIQYLASPHNNTSLLNLGVDPYP